MFSLRHFLAAAGVSTAICGAVVLFSRCENPRELAIGDWKGSNSPLQAEVTEDTVYWHAASTRGKFSYAWLQEKESPYLVRFHRGKTQVDADVTFDGSDTIIVEPRIFGQLPPALQEHLRDRNKSLGRPETEIRLVFRRLKKNK